MDKIVTVRFNIAFHSSRLTWLPMGSGKTEVVSAYMKSFGALQSVLAPSFRSCLALTLSNRLGIGYYKLVDNVQGWRRRSVCLNSIVHVPAELLSSYDLVVFDEAGFLRRYMVSETMGAV